MLFHSSCYNSIQHTVYIPKCFLKCIMLLPCFKRITSPKKRWNNVTSFISIYYFTILYPCWDACQSATASIFETIPIKHSEDILSRRRKDMAPDKHSKGGIVLVLSTDASMQRGKGFPDEKTEWAQIPASVNGNRQKQCALRSFHGFFPFLRQFWNGV